MAQDSVNAVQKSDSSEIKCTYGFLNILPQFIPCIGLSKNAFGQTLGNEAAIRFLCNFKYKFIHGLFLLI